MGLALNLPECQDGHLGKVIKKNTARVGRAATREFRKARENKDFVRKLIAREVSLPAKMAQMETMGQYVEQFRDIYRGAIIHRTIKSLDWKGDPISGLPPLHEKVLALQPSPEEKKALLVMADQIVHDEKVTKGKYWNRADNVSVRFFSFAFENHPTWSGSRTGARGEALLSSNTRSARTRPGRVQ